MGMERFEARNRLHVAALRLETSRARAADAARAASAQATNNYASGRYDL